MSKMTKLLVLALAAAALMIGCSQEFDPAGAPTGPAASMATEFDMLNANVVSATLYVHVNLFSGHEVYVHRVTADWDEGTVTWNNFGGFDPAVSGSFTSDALGWKTADVTALVQGWLDGDYDNFGLLLKQTDHLFPRTETESREVAGFEPYLEICVETPMGPDCTQFMAMGDASIFENYPNDNTGTVPELFIGWHDETEAQKQALIRFSIPTLPEPAALGDFVWYDMNEDGIQDEGEPGIEGVTVHLMDCLGNILAETTTDADGFYLFSDLMPGDYNVHFVAPPAFVFSPQDQGADDAMDSDANPANGMTICTTLEAGETDLTWDAGLYMPPPQEGCTLTIGFWKNHAGFGPQPDYLSQFLPIMLGDWEVADVQTAYDILTQKVYGHPSNGITKLYAQLLAAKLNAANGASTDDINGAMQDADEFLTMYDWMDWGSFDKQDQKDVNWLKSTFDDYNNGDIGPGHCDQFGDGDDD